MKRAKQDGAVLVGVVKNKRDLTLLFKEHWYRMPLAYAPVRDFKYLAFYQPAIFGKAGKQIRYWAQVGAENIKKRRELLPKETKHRRANDDYKKIKVGIIRKLARPIKNIVPRRVTFGFTTLENLLTAKNILQIYQVADTENIMREALKRARIKAEPQYSVRRYRLDFAIFCQRGQIAVECDNKKAHSGKVQKIRDQAKNFYLRRHHWKVIRLAEDDIVKNTSACISVISKQIKSLGGLS